MDDAFFDRMMARARAMEAADRTRSTAGALVESGSQFALAALLVGDAFPWCSRIVGCAAAGMIVAGVALGVRSHRQRRSAP